MKLDLDQDDLRPLVAAVLDQLRTEQPTLPERLSFPEAEAATLLGVPRHVLRDARLRGEITGRLLGKKIIYARSELIRFVEGK